MTPTPPTRSGTPRRAWTLALLVAGTTACFTTATDFRDDAEAFIVDDDGLQSALLGDSGARFTSATCADPVNQDAGTTFACTATDSNADVWEFEVEITDADGYEVTLARRPTGP